jgi:peptidylprolyl isomerase
LGEPVDAPQDRMLTVQILADMPAASRPNVQLLNTSTDDFKAQVAKMHAAQHDDFNPCAVDTQAVGG